VKFLAKMGSYEQMYKAAYDKTYATATAAFKRAMGNSSVWATTNGVNDAIEQAAKDWLRQYEICIVNDEREVQS